MHLHNYNPKLNPTLALKLILNISCYPIGDGKQDCGPPSQTSTTEELARSEPGNDNPDHLEGLDNIAETTTVGEEVN